MIPLVQINIATVSSPSSQMGLVIAYRYFFDHIVDCLKTPQLLIVIVKNGKNAENSLPHFLKQLTNLSTVRRGSFVSVLVIRNYFDLLLIYILLWLVSSLSLIFTIRLWQTRFQWINELFSSKSLSFALPIPSFKKVLFGDGFLQEIVSSSPFWLASSTSGTLSKYIHPKNLIASIYHFKLIDKSCPYDYSSQRHCIPKEILYSRLNEFVNDNCSSLDSRVTDSILTNNIFKTTNAITIFPATSFSETNRCSLISEINLYKKYIKSNFTDSFVIIKPHPASSRAKLHALEQLAKDINGLLLCDSKWDIPLELFVHQMVHKIDIGKINLVIASTAGVSCARLFDSINYTTAFGLELLKDCLDPRDLHSRLAQERLMSELLEFYSCA